MTNDIKVIIPAAGKGSRLHCVDLPKAMHRVLDTPLLEIVLKNTEFIKPEDTYIVVGYKKEKITDYFGDKYNYVEQNEQLGTGHAVNVCSDLFRDFDGTVLVTFGDMPLFRREILEKICDHHKKTGAACTLLCAKDPDICNWAKIVRNENGIFSAIVESADLTEKEDKKFDELFAGVLAFDSKELFRALPELHTSNAQGEYYLTEVPELMSKKGLKIETILTDDSNDLRGVNTPQDLIICEKVLKERLNK